jgi:hypothetical protein
MTEAWRVAVVKDGWAHKDIALVYTEYMAKRMTRYAGDWIQLEEGEDVEAWPVMLPEMLTSLKF